VATILIVEDSPDNMKLFRTVLSLRGHTVVPLPGGDNLLEALDQHQPDLILMDIQLPGRDGFALLEDVRASNAHASRKVLALTAHAMAGDREKAQAAGFDGYITKPIDVRTFAGEIEAALPSRSA
jgi:CheY-like chemotaxis protein